MCRCIVLCVSQQSFLSSKKKSQPEFYWCWRIEESGVSLSIICIMYFVYLDYVRLCEKSRRGRWRQDIEEDKVYQRHPMALPRGLVRRLYRMTRKRGITVPFPVLCTLCHSSVCTLNYYHHIFMKYTSRLHTHSLLSTQEREEKRAKAAERVLLELAKVRLTEEAEVSKLLSKLKYMLDLEGNKQLKETLKKNKSIPQNIKKALGV